MARTPCPHCGVHVPMRLASRDERDCPACGKRIAFDAEQQPVQWRPVEQEPPAEE